jgi:hypothetical protein
MSTRYRSRVEANGGGGCLGLAVILFWLVILIVPIWVVSYFLQRIFISIKFLKLILKITFYIVVGCSIIGIVSVFYNWLSWERIIYEFGIKCNFKISPNEAPLN